jgi:taurine transport system ATP-binding protein
MRFDLPNGSSVQALKDVSLNLKEGELLSGARPVRDAARPRF